MNRKTKPAHQGWLAWWVPTLLMRCDPSFGKYKGTLGVINWVWLVFSAQNTGFTFQEKENECWQTAYTKQKDVWSAQNEWTEPTWNQQILPTVCASSRPKAQLEGRGKNGEARSSTFTCQSRLSYDPTWLLPPYNMPLTLYSTPSSELRTSRGAHREQHHVNVVLLHNMGNFRPDPSSTDPQVI